MFQNNLLMAAAGGVKAVDIQYQGLFGSDASSRTYTYSSAPLGDAATDRIIVVACAYANYSNTLSSCTVGGVTMTQIVTDTSPNAKAYLLYKAVATGTSADIVVTWTGGSGTPTDGAIAVWSVYNSTGTPYASNEDTNYTASSVALDASLNVPNNGGLIAYTSRGLSGGGPPAITGATEDFDETAGAELAQRGASINLAIGESPRSVTAAAINYSRLLTCSWGPP